MKTTFKYFHVEYVYFLPLSFPILYFNDYRYNIDPVIKSCFSNFLK